LRLRREVGMHTLMEDWRWHWLNCMKDRTSSINSSWVFSRRSPQRPSADRGTMGDASTPVVVVASA